MKKDVLVYIADILESANTIKEYVKGMSEEDFLKDKKTIDSVISRFIIIGEAVKRVNDDFKNKYSDVSWKRMAGLRDILTHAYDKVDAKQLWKIIKENVDGLRKQLRDIQKKEETQ